MTEAASKLTFQTCDSFADAVRDHLVSSMRAQGFKRDDRRLHDPQVTKGLREQAIAFAATAAQDTPITYNREEAVRRGVDLAFERFTQPSSEM